MKKHLWLFLMLLAPLAKSAPVDGLHPVITDTEMQVQVIYTPLTGIYEYRYTLVSGQANAGVITILSLDLLTANPQPEVFDPGLYSDTRRDDEFTGPAPVPKRTVPVGIQSPYGWTGGVGITGELIWGADKIDTSIFPGQSLGGLILQAKAPPGVRIYRIEPNFDYSSGEEGDGGPEPQDFWVTGTTIGPVLPSELKIINGKGQSAAVNEFLAYSNLTATRTTLPATAKGFDLAVKYGNTTLPGTFSATLNGVNVTASFRPNPGAFDVVRIPLMKGTNTLLLSIEGLKPSGARSRDTDRLTFIVP